MVLAWHKWYKHNKKWKFISRAYSSSLLHAIIVRNHLPFFKIFLSFVRTCLPKVWNILPLFCRFSGKLHELSYFLEYWSLSWKSLYTKILSSIVMSRSKMRNGFLGVRLPALTFKDGYFWMMSKSHCHRL